MALRLLAASALVAAVGAQFDCRHTSYIAPDGRRYQVSSPGYPGSYARPSLCYWYFYTDPGYRLSISCPTVNLDSNGDWYCRDTLSLYGSRADGNYCTSFSSESLSNRMLLSLQVSPTSQGGRFQCTVQVIRQACDCGWSYRQKIVGGQDARINEFPSMAALIDARKGAVEVCGATIISPRYVVTAAHCLNVLSVAYTGVLVGEHDLSTGTETDATKLYRARRFVPHPNYATSGARNDIALIETALNMVFSARVGPACLPFNRPQVPEVGEQVTVLGWGTTSFGGPVSDVLQKANLRVIPIQRCQESYPLNPPAGDVQICTYEQGKDSCQMDSGGPLLSLNNQNSRYYLAGLVSYGKGCAGEDPSVSTRVYAYLGWIANVTGGEQNFCIK